MFPLTGAGIEDREGGGPRRPRVGSHPVNHQVGEDQVALVEDRGIVLVGDRFVHQGVGLQERQHVVWGGGIGPLLTLFYLIK